MKLVYLSFAIIVLTIGVFCQTASEFQQKFGSPLEAYMVRPDILMTVQYDTTGKATTLTFEPRHARAENSFSLFPGLASSEVEKLLAELVPAVSRGKRVNTISYNSGCNGIYVEAFTNLSITRAGSCSGKGAAVLYSVQVHRKKR